MKFSPFTIGSLLLVLLLIGAGPDWAGGQGITVQLPTVSFFSVRTVVSVPDGGSMHLGGVGRSVSGHTSRGVPGLGNLPLVNRGFRNQAFGGQNSPANARVFVQIIDSKEIEEQVMSAAARRLDALQEVDPNGPPAVRRKADFISRNIGRTKKR